MSQHRFQARMAMPLVACLLFGTTASMAAESPAAISGDKSNEPRTASSQKIDIEKLRKQIAEQQKQIDAMQRMLADQQRLLDAASEQPAEVAVQPRPVRAPLGEVASTTPMIPAAQEPPKADGLKADPPSDINKKLDGLLKNLGGIKLSGDLRLRFDLQDRSSTSVAGPVQNARERYRVRLNVDKDLFFGDKSDHPLAKFHVQLATAPFNNQITMDTDFAGVDTRAPISVAEAWVDLLPTKNITLRGGRTSEVFADQSQFIYDDDIRFNGFNENIRLASNQKAYLELKAGQYILTNPNTPIVGAGSPYLNAGYLLGQKMRSAELFDQGLTAGFVLNKKWSQTATFNYSVVTNPNQIQLASTAAGSAVLIYPAVGATLTGNLAGTGNATTVAGGAIYFATAYKVIRGAYALDYAGSDWKGHNVPFQFLAQVTHNTGADIANNGYALSVTLGQTKRLGDFRIGYRYFYKPANGFISQFTDDDAGTGTGVNLKTHAIRLDLGLTRFLAWENRIFIQNELARNNPAINFFVPLQAGAGTMLRIQSQLNFTF